MTLTRRLTAFSTIAVIWSTVGASASTVYNYEFDFTRDFVRYWTYYAETPDGEVAIDVGERSNDAVPFETTETAPGAALFNATGLSLGFTGPASITTYVNGNGAITSVDCGGVLASFTYCHDSFLVSGGNLGSTASNYGFNLLLRPGLESTVEFSYDRRNEMGFARADNTSDGSFENEQYPFLLYNGVRDVATLSNGRFPPVPLPATLPLLGLGLLAFGWAARRKVTA